MTILTVRRQRPAAGALDFGQIRSEDGGAAIQHEIHYFCLHHDRPARCVIVNKDSSRLAVQALLQ